MPTLSLLLALAAPANAQQVIQIPVCAGNLPSSINPSAPTITVNASGQVCIAGNFSASVTVPTPQVAIPQPLSTVITTVAGVVSGSYADGALVTLGSIADSAYTTVGTSGDVVALLKGIFANVITPVAVTGSFAVSSPLGVNIAATTPINVTVGGAVSPLAVTIASSPVNVTGSLSIAQTGQNIVQLAGQTLASPTSFGSAPVGSVQGVNAFVTNNVNVTTPTPLQATLPASPVSVGLPATPLSVVVANSPAVVPTGTLAVNVVNTPTVTNLPSASPQSMVVVNTVNATTTPGVSPQNVTVGNTISANTTPTVSPQNVTVANIVTTTPGTSPQNVTVGNTVNATTTPSVSPQNVTIAASPLNVTLVAIPGSPQSMIVTSTPLAANLSLPSAAAVIAYSATPLSALASSPGTVVVSGTHQFARVYCALRAPVTVTTSVYLRLYDTTSAQLATGVQRGFLLIAANGAAPATGISAGLTALPPGEQYSSGIVAIIATTAVGAISGSGSSLTTETTDCIIAYN